MARSRWLEFSNFSGLQAVRLGGGQVFAKATYPDGSEGYNSVLIVPVDSPIQSIEDILTCDGSIDFGMGDPNSTSGYLVPSAFIFAPRGIDPSECFNSVRNANHEANAVAVANGLIDVGTNNTTNMTLLQRTRPDIAARIRVIWTSPPIQTDPIIWRSDLDDEAKQRLQYFFMNYGRMGTPEEIAAAREVLDPLYFGLFLPSSNAHLDPIVQLEIVRDLTEARNDPDLSEAERETRVAALRERLAEVEAGNTGLISQASAVGDVQTDGPAPAEVSSINWLASGAMLGLALVLLTLLLWASAPRGPGPRVPLFERVANAVIAAGVIIILVWSFDSADMDRSYLLVENAGDMGEFIAGFFPDDISSAASRTEYGQNLMHGFSEAVPQMIVTVQIAIWGTFIAIFSAIPFGLLSARNVAPNWVVQPVRRLMDVFRSINELIIALVFIAAVGLGPLAGVMALAVHTTGVLAKLFSEAVEAIDNGPRGGCARHRRHAAARSDLGRDPAGRSALDLFRSLPVRVECAFGHRARPDRGGRYRSDPVRSGSRLRLSTDRGHRDRHRRGRQRHRFAVTIAAQTSRLDSVRLSRRNRPGTSRSRAFFLFAWGFSAFRGILQQTCDAFVAKPSWIPITSFREIPKS